MSWLNYHHLYYFYVVAREGSVSAAARELHLTQPTVSTQLGLLERTLGDRLFERRARRLVLTDAGRVAYRYAQEIFALGREFQDALRGHAAERPARLVVGVSDAVPKLIAFELLKVVLAPPTPVQLTCHDDTPEHLLAALAAHELDLVLGDAPAGPATSPRVFSHLLGECGVTVFGPPALARRLRPRFPASLDGAPFLLPTEQASLRRELDACFERLDVRPAVQGQFADSALLKVFGQAGAGCFAAPSAIEAEVRRQYGVHVVGRIPDVRERFYAITAERRIAHPAVRRVTMAAHDTLFR